MNDALNSQMSLSEISDKDRRMIVEIKTLWRNNHSQLEISEIMGIDIKNVQKYQALMLKYFKESDLISRYAIAKTELKLLRICRTIARLKSWGEPTNKFEEVADNLQNRMDKQTKLLINNQ